MPYRVEISPAAERELRRLPSNIRGRLENAIYSLEIEPRPHGVRKLAGQEHTYRLRAGDYRIVYDVYDAERLVVVFMAARRSTTTYRRRR